ncbi:MAG: sigma-70 family RNA polymerase sigma factor [Ilumatobacteraceae bacterium]
MSRAARSSTVWPSPEDALRSFRETGDPTIRNRVVEEHRWLAVVIAQDFRTGSEPLDDLVQVACVALLKAADRFDPDFGVEYRTYAAVTVRGELRRYFRDSTWAVRVPRRLQELRYEIRAATEVLQERLHRSPTTPELAAYLHVDQDEIIDSICADSNFRSLSLDHEDSDSLPGRRGGSVDDLYDDVDALDAFHEIAGLLPERLRRVVEMRFIEEMKQSDIAHELGVSQVQVSRLLRSANRRMRLLLEHRASRTLVSDGATG